MIWRTWFGRVLAGFFLAAALGSAAAEMAWGQESAQLIRNRPLVRDVQAALRDKGFDPGPVDGVMGPMTRDALRRYQQANGLESNGLMTDATLQSLDVEIPAPEGDDKKDRGLLATAASKVSSAAKATAGATAEGAKAAAGATATGAKAAAGATATGAKAAAGATATGATAAAEGAATGGKAAGSAVATGAKASADAGETGGKAAVSGVKTAGGAVGSVAGGAKRLLFGGDDEEKLGREVIKALEKDRVVDVSHVEVAVEGKIVTLTFTGGSTAEWNRAVVVAKRVKGVERVFVRTP